MKGNLKKLIIPAAVLASLGLAAVAFFAGRSLGRAPLLKERETLQALNRASIEKLPSNGETIHVIGHRSPDSDTVCSAIAYARLLTKLGYNAEAKITASVNHESAYILREAGVEMPPVLESAAGESIFLVDHSEYAQAAEDMEDAHIIGILDHHGVGSVTTGHMIVYEARPIGATATIVWLDYLNYGIELDKSTAYLLLGAVLSDTSNLTASTVTEADKIAVTELAKLAEVKDVNALYAALHAELLSYEGMSDDEIFFSDYKEYEAYGIKFGIGIVNAIDIPTAEQLAERMKNALPDAFASREVELMYASIGMRENGEKIDYIVPCNEHSRQILADAFPDSDEFNGTAFIFKSGLGRKTKFVPGLTEFLGAYPHE